MEVQFDSYKANPLVGITRDTPADTLAKWRMRKNAEAIREAFDSIPRPRGISSDAVAGEKALALARQLEHIHAEVLQEVYEDLNALTLIPSDSSVPAGAKTHTIRRKSSSGRAVFFRGNSRDLGEVAVDQEEQSFKIWPVVTKIDLNFFDQLAAGFAGISLESDLRSAAERVMDEFRNDKTWNGDSDFEVPGMLTAPFSGRAVAAETFGPNGATASAQLAELHRLANSAAEHTKSKFKPTDLAMPIQYLNYFSTTHLDTANSSNQSILQAFLDKNRYVRAVHEVHEMNGAGGGTGTDALLFFRAGDKRAAHAVIPQGFTMLPMQRSGFDMYMPAYMLFGGVNQYDPLNNLIVDATFA